MASLLAMLFVAMALPGEPAHATGSDTTPLTSGQLTMVSTHADGTSGTPVSGIEGANQVAINDDGSAVAFVSDVPAEDLVTDPAQLATGVTDNNTGVGSTADKGDDVFLYRKTADGAIVSLVSWDVEGTGTGNAPSTAPVMAPHGLGLAFQSSATDLVTGHVDANQNHLYAWVPGLGSPTGVFLVDTKYQSSDACDCSAQDPSIALFPAATVVFEATGSTGNELIAAGIKGEDDEQIYAHDVVLGTNTLVSVTNDSTVPNARSAIDPDVGNGAVGGASQPMIASDAPIVVFTSVGDDLVDGFDSSNGSNIWEHNLLTGVTTLVSPSASGDPNGTTGNHDPVTSDLGTSVAWQSNDPDVSTTPFFNPQQSVDHIFYRVTSPTPEPTLMVDTDKTGLIGCDSASTSAGLSGDGLSVVFQSDCDDISTVPDTNGDADVFERTLAPIPQVAPELLSSNDSGTSTGNGASRLCAPDDLNFNFPCESLSDPSIGVNYDGTVVSYYTDATDIAGPAQGVPPFNEGSVIASYPKLFGGVKNVLVSARPDGAYADNSAGDAVISKDGGSVAFVSDADNLVPNDTNDYFDVFESDLHNTFSIQPIAPVSEGDGSVLITVERTGSDGTSDSVQVETGDGSTPALPVLPPEITDPAHANAVAPGDYTATTKTLTFPPGVDVQTFTVPITDDMVAEAPELFHVSLSDPTGAGSVPPPGPLSDAYVVILDNDAPAQGWHVAVTQQPTTAHVGDTVTVKATITVDAGADDLDVTSLSSGAGSSGLDQVSFADSTPFTVSAGTTKDVTATARVVAAPGTGGIHLQVSVGGTLGAAATTETADSAPITSVEAVTASLGVNSLTPGLPDKLTYTLTATNASSSTPAQLTGLPAAFVAPAGTTQATRTNGTTTIAPGASSTWTLVVDVNDADVDGTVITQVPSAFSYAMSAIGLAARQVAITPTSVSSTVAAPVVTVGPHTLTDLNGGTLSPGDAVSVSIRVTNTGHAGTTATLSDSLTNLQAPTSIKRDGATCGACTSTATSVTAPLGTLAAGGSHVVTFTATIPAAPAGTTASSSAKVTFSPASTGTSPTTPNVASLTIAPPTTRADLSISIDDSPDPVGVRETVTYTLTVKNGGPGLATGVIVTDQLPSTLTFVAAESTQGSCSRSSGVVTCAIGTLAKNGKAKIKIKVTTTATGKFPNTASVAGAQPDPHNADNTDSVTTHVIGSHGH